MKKMLVRSSILALASVVLLAPATFALEGSSDAVAEAERALGAPTAATNEVVDAGGPSLLDLIVGFLLVPVHGSDGPQNGADGDPEPSDRGPYIDPVGQQTP